MRVLLTGANGQLGQCLKDRFPDEWQVWGTDATELDITNKDTVFNAIEKYQPDVIINAAAYTAVDKAESDVDLARLVNVRGPANLAAAARNINAMFVHVSTDYVFDGASNIPYQECDATNPLGVYGLTKLDGERYVLEEYSSTVIIRTAWVFSEYGNNFVKTMLKLGNEKESLGIISDQYGCPTYAGDIASAIITLIDNKSEGGIYHFCGDKVVSWYDFANRIFSIAKEMGWNGNIREVKAITTEQYPTAAKRPRYSVLDCRKISQKNVSPSDWNNALLHVIKEII